MGVFAVKRFSTAVCLAALVVAEAQNSATMALDASESVAPLLESGSFQTLLFIQEDADLDTELRTPGYDDNYAWIYERLPDASDSEQLGIGVASLPCSHSWRKKYRPQALPRHNFPQQRRVAQSGLPFVCDLAIAPYSHACMRPMDDIPPLDPCWPNPASEYVHYSVCTTAGRELWQSIWKTDAEAFAEDISAKPSAYRLFARASLWDVSSLAKNAASHYFRSQWKNNVSLLNRECEPNTRFASLGMISRFDKTPKSPAEHALYCSFLEWAFASAVSNGAAAMAPTPVFFQPARLNMPGIDLESAFRECGLLCAPAIDVEPLFTALYMRAIAGGRPILSPEIVPSDDPRQTQWQILTQFARGYSGATLSPSRRMPRSWMRYRKNQQTGRTELDEQSTLNAGVSLASATPANWMNPLNVAPSNLVAGLSGGMVAVRAVEARLGGESATLAAPNAERVAILYSRPAVRLGFFGGAQPEPIEPYARAAVFGGYATRVILERDLDGTTNICPNVKVIIVPNSMDACLNSTITALTNWVEHGGTVIAGSSALSRRRFGPERVGGIAFPRVANVSTNEFVATSLGEGSIITFNPGELDDCFGAALARHLRERLPSRDWICEWADGSQELPKIEIHRLRDSSDSTPLLMAISHEEKTAEVRLSIDGSPARLITLEPGECTLVEIGR